MTKRDPVARARASIAAIRRRVEVMPFPRADHEWGGANVVISTVSLGGRYREIVTRHAFEISWLFGQLRDAFTGMIDSCSKFEFYGRLELAANGAISERPDVTAPVLCNALLDEADAMLAEMEVGRFQVLPVALGVEIAHDHPSKKNRG